MVPPITWQPRREYDVPPYSICSKDHRGMSTSQLNDLLGQLEAALLDKDANLQSVMLRTEAFLQFAESASEHARRE